MTRSSIRLTACLLTCFTLTAAAGPHWDQWRGPKRDGTFSGAKWPEKLESVKQLWRLPLGESYSGPVTSGSLVFTTETKDKQFELAHGVDAETGKIVWTAQWEGRLSVPFFAKRNGDWIRSTPALDEDTLYVSGMQDVLVALNTADGKEKWRVDFPKDLKSGAQAFGYVASPLLDGASLYTHAGAGLCKLERKTGKLLWRSMDDGGGMNGGSFSSPILATVAGRRQVVAQGRSELSGLDPENGTVLWSQAVKSFRGMNIYTPVVAGSRIFTSPYGGQSQAWDIAKKDESLQPSLAWEHKSEGYMSTPVLIDGRLYMHLRNQKLACMDLASGKQLWVSDQKFGEYMSLVAQGDRILALDMKGVLYLIKANPEKLEIIDQKKVSEAECWAHLAVEDGRLYIRELKGLSAWEWK
jgi:outer membrane protein assembly factor BamB